MRVKICGITTVSDALFVENAGCDAVGVVISEESLRNVSPEKAEEIFKSLGPFISRVVVTHTESEDELDEILSLNPTAIQISTGLKIPDTYRGKIIRVVTNTALIPSDCDAIIIDGSRGEGIPYNAETAKEIARLSKVPVILAGGLNPSNVGEAIDKVKPYAVDVCSGVEEKPGLKNRFEVLEFMRACGKMPSLRLKENYFG